VLSNSELNKLYESTQEKRDQLLNHEIYSLVDQLPSVRTFMESHIFAVWDFMSLVKTLQQRITCVTTPWIPVDDVGSARFINEIVLAEESDEIGTEKYSSHFDLYLGAMTEIGADTKTIKAFISEIKKDNSPKSVLLDLPILESTKGFVFHTLSTITGKTHEVAAAFLFGREDIIPIMFRKFLEQNSAEEHFPLFSLYLQRHIQLDESHHGPMAKKLLTNLCRDSQEKWSESLEAAKKAIHARIDLWDGVVSILRRT